MRLPARKIFLGDYYGLSRHDGTVYCKYSETDWGTIGDTVAFTYIDDGREGEYIIAIGVLSDILPNGDVNIIILRALVLWPVANECRLHILPGKNPYHLPLYDSYYNRLYLYGMIYPVVWYNFV